MNLEEMPLSWMLSEVDLATMREIITPRDSIHVLANWYSPIADFAISEIEARMGMALCREFMPEIMDVGWTLGVIWPQFKANRLHPDLHFQLDFLVMRGDRKIGVECDGKAFHSSPKQKAKDEFRTRKIFEKCGLRIVRFTGTEIYQKAELCARTVRTELMQ